eukprot:g11528.t1
MAHLEMMLVDFFKRADTDGSGSVSKDEFNNMLLCTDIMKPQDFGELFDWLDSDKDGCVNIDEFLRGFRWLVATIDPKGLLKLEEELAGDFHRLTRRMVDHVNHCFDQLLESVSVPLRKISAITEQIQRLDRLITALLRCPEELEGKIECASLDQVEARLAKKLESGETARRSVTKRDESYFLTKRTGVVKLDRKLESVSSMQDLDTNSPWSWRKMASGISGTMDLPNDDQEELPKGIGRASGAVCNHILLLAFPKEATQSSLCCVKGAKGAAQAAATPRGLCHAAGWRHPPGRWR